MADTIVDGTTRVAWVSSLGNPAAPTTTELNGSADYTPRLTPDGLKLDPTTADVDTSSLASVFDTTEAGRVSYDVELTFKRGTTGTADDAPYATLRRGVHGYLVVRRNIPYTTAWASGQQVEVYYMACGEPANVSPAANEVGKFKSPMKVTVEPNTYAMVA